MYSTFLNPEGHAGGRFGKPMSAATGSLRRSGGSGIELRRRHRGKCRKDFRPNVISLTIGGLSPVYISAGYQDFGNQCGCDRPIDKI
jgi:hypothetical protein